MVSIVSTKNLLTRELFSSMINTCRQFNCPELSMHTYLPESGSSEAISSLIMTPNHPLRFPAILRRSPLSTASGGSPLAGRHRTLLFSSYDSGARRRRLIGVMGSGTAGGPSVRPSWSGLVWSGAAGRRG